jgi:hypothetical protein
MKDKPVDNQCLALGYQKPGCKKRRRSRGANLAMLCAMAVMIIGFMGIAIFTGIQAYLESDLQRASMNAALAGAAAYYSGKDGNGKPIPDSGQAMGIATSTFNAIVTNSSLNGFGAAIQSVTNNDNNDSITVESRASVGTPLLAPLGITSIETTATATARALRYEPTQFITGGTLDILPVAGDINSYSKVIELAFPIVDGPGSDIYIEQNAAMQQGYVVEACNSTECYNLVPAARRVGTSQKLTVNGTQVMYGTFIIDLADAGVRKASKLRFTHANDYQSYNAGAPNAAPAGPTPLEIRRVLLFGYSSACVTRENCPIPAGFMPVE